MKKIRVLLLIPVFLSMYSCTPAGSQAPLMVPDTSADVISSEAEEKTAVYTGDILMVPETEPAPAEEEPAETQPPYENRNSVFKAGTWFSYTPEESRYYFFYNDNSNGARMMVSQGMVSPFAYELPEHAGENGIRKGTFHFNTADNSTGAEVEMKDNESAVIKWKDGKTEKLTFISENGIGNFNLYTDEELCKMALKYYKTSEGDSYKLNKAVCTTNEDRSVSVKIYKIAQNDSEVVLKWYIVDRHTAEGFVSEDGKTRTSKAVDIK